MISRNDNYGYWAILPLLLGFIVFSRQCVKAWSINIWSLELLNSFQESASIEQISSPPDDHQRAEVWLINLALDQRRIETAQSLLTNVDLKNNPFAYSAYGRLLELSGDNAGSIEVLKESRNYQGLLLVASRADQEGRFQDAITAAEAAWMMYPEDTALTLSKYYQKTGDYQSAEELLKTMIVIYPHTYQLEQWYLGLGAISRVQREWDEAYTYYTYLEEHYPENHLAHIGLGWVYYERDNDKNLALDEFSAATRINPTSGDGYFAAGQLYSKDNEYSLAEEYFKKAIENDPKNRWWKLARANNLRSGESYPEAIDLYQELLQEYPNWINPYIELGWTFLLFNQPEQALAVLESAVNLEKIDDPWLLFKVIGIYLRAEKLELAAHYFDIAENIIPAKPADQDAIFQIQSLRENTFPNN